MTSTLARKRRPRQNDRGVGPERDSATRREIGRELHDGVLQDLLCVSMGIAEVRSAPSKSSEVDDRLEQLEWVTRNAYQRLREIINSARETQPASAEYLRPLLEQCVEAFNRGANAHARLRVMMEPSKSISPETARHVASIVTEAMWNAWRHAEAHRLMVSLSEVAGSAWIRVADDGQGFDPSDVPSDHYGLQGMRERADAIGAQLSISSAPGMGTRVDLHLPALSLN